MIEIEIKDIFSPLAGHSQDDHLLWYHIFSDDVVFHCPETPEGKQVAQEKILERQREVVRIITVLLDNITKYDIRVHTDRSSTRLSWVPGNHGWIDIHLASYSISDFLRNPLRSLTEEKVL